jgi:serine/threonine protein phosphatase PrpC
MSRSAFSILAGLLIALQLIVCCSSTALAASTPATSQPQNLARAGVSVVRLLATYTSASSKAPSSVSAQCTGLGVLVASWQFRTSSELNTWILTDGNLVNNSGQATCVGSHPTAKLASLDIYFSNAYNPQIGPITQTAPVIRCQEKNCDRGPALVAFNFSTLLPFIDLADKDTTPVSGIELTKSATSLEAPMPSSTDARQAAQFVQQSQQSLTPNLLPVSATAGENESGMPVVDSTGNLAGMHLAGVPTLTASDIKTFLQKQPELTSLQTNAVHDNWNTGITDFYQNNFSAANKAFEAAAAANPQFQGAKDFAQRTAAASLQGGENGGPGTRSATSPKGITIAGIPVPYLLLGIAGLIVLAILLVLVSITFGRARALRVQHNRALKAEYAEAERRAAIDAQRIAEQEAAQQQGWPPQLSPAQPPMPMPQGGMQTVPLQTLDLRCPRCGEPVPPEANYCSNCRLPLMPTETGHHLSVVPQMPAAMSPVLPASSVAEQPTIEMSPSMARNGQAAGQPGSAGQPTQVDQDKTVPYTWQQLKGNRLGFAVGTRSDPGIKRKYKPNEDSLFAAQGAIDVDGSSPQFGLFVIADGMGGHANGQDASRRAIQTIIDFILPRLMLKNGERRDDALAQLLAEGVQCANQAVHQNNMELHADMGTTVTAALVVGATAYVANVGDSRTYLYRETEGLKKVTNDHSVVASLVEAGIIKPDDIYTHPKRNQIYRSLGEKPVVEVDTFTVQLQPGDKLLLCTDGLWDMVRDPKIEYVLKSQASAPDATADALIQAALEGGGEDNVSVIVVSLAETAQHTLTPGIQLLAKPETVQMPQL